MLADFRILALVFLLKIVVTAAGADPTYYSSHSLRSGGATAAYHAGLTIEWLMREGRWEEMESLMKYLRANPRAAADIAAKMISSTQTASRSTRAACRAHCDAAPRTCSAPHARQDTLRLAGLRILCLLSARRVAFGSPSWPPVFCPLAVRERPAFPPALTCTDLPV